MIFHQSLNKHYDEIEKAITFKTQRDREIAFEKYISMYNVTKEFLKEQGLLLYGGLAVNLTLPKDRRFYTTYELPDYDFFSPQAKKHAIELADKYHALGYKYVEVRPGIHFETYKVYVDFMPVADITDVPDKLFKQLLQISMSEKSMILENNPGLDVNIAPLSFLRLAFHIELSRPNGYIERWMKIYKRMILFYHQYPVVFDNCNHKAVMYSDPETRVTETTSLVLQFCKTHNLPILGTEAVKIYMSYHLKRKIDPALIFDKNMSRVEVISTDYQNTALSIQQILSSTLEKDETIVIKTHSPLNKSEFIPKHSIVSIIKGGNSRNICTVYSSQACYSYKSLDGLNVLSIDSMLSLMYAYMFSKRDYYVINKVKCMINMLLNMQIQHQTSKKYVWKRFDLLCYGEQLTIEDTKKKRWHNKSKKFQVYRPHDKV